MSENTEIETGSESGKETDQSSGKPDKSGLYLVCNGAKCKCDQSNEQQQADFEVLSQSTTYINDADGADKLVGTTLDLGIPFKVKASTFGTCYQLKNPSGTYLPCSPAVTNWSDAYESIVLDNTGKVLVKESYAQCAIGGKIEFATHGQEQEVTQADAEEASNQSALTPMLTEEQIRELTFGEFKNEDEKKRALVESVATTDGRSQYFFNKEKIALKVDQYLKSNPNPSETVVKGVNWAVFYKKPGEHESKFKQQGIYKNIGSEFNLPFKTKGNYVVEAFGNANGPDYLKNKPKAAYKKITLRDQTIDGLSLFVGDDERERVRPSESAIIKMKSVFSIEEMIDIRGENSVDNLIWEVEATYNGKNILVNFLKNPLKRSGITISPLKTRANVKVKVTTVDRRVTKELTYQVGENYVTAIEVNKKTVSVWEKGNEKERHLVKLKVSQFIIEPALESEKAAVKWTRFKPGETPKENHVIANGFETIQHIESLGAHLFEAYMNFPEGGEKRTTKRVESVLPEITKAYWADSKGSKISRSGFEHTVYFHLETLGLTGESLKLNIWKSNTDDCDSFVKELGESEITSHEGSINYEVILPKSNSQEQKYYVTIEELDFSVLGTAEDSGSNNEHAVWKDHKSKTVDYLYVNDKKKITSLKIYEAGNKLHTGIVKYGDTISIKLTSRNMVDEELDFEVWKDVNGDNGKKGDYSSHDTNDDLKFSEIVSIKVDKEGNGTADFTIPSDWEGHQGEAIAQFFYLKYGNEEFPRANYTRSLNTKDETSKSNLTQINTLMIKVSDSHEPYTDRGDASPVILGEELTNSILKKGQSSCPFCGVLTMEGLTKIFRRATNDKKTQLIKASSVASYIMPERIVDTGKKFKTQTLSKEWNTINPPTKKTKTGSDDLIDWENGDTWITEPTEGEFVLWTFRYEDSNKIQHWRTEEVNFMEAIEVTSKSKINIIERSDWGARKPRTGKGYSYDKIDQPLNEYYNAIVIHHSGNSNNNPSINDVQDEHMDGKDKADIGYHFAIGLDGKIYEGRKIGRMGAHVNKANTGKIGIVILGDMDEKDDGLSDLARTFEWNDSPKTQEMYDSLLILIKHLSHRYDIQQLGVHKDVNCERFCPGDTIKGHINYLRIKLALQSLECVSGK